MDRCTPDTPELLEQLHRLVSRPEWEWMDGMLAKMNFEFQGTMVAQSMRVISINAFLVGWVPVVDDPATQGCLWHMLLATGEVWAWEGDGGITTLKHANAGTVLHCNDCVGVALVDALLHVWVPPQPT